MSIPVQSVDGRKLIELVVYLTNSLKEPTYHSVSKMLYFADKMHLSKYGRLISGDSYVAMSHGPVPSAVYDIMKVPREGAVFMRPDIRDAVLAAIGVRNKHHLVALRNADADFLSASEIECLDETVKLHGHKSFTQLTSETHDAAWNSADENETIALMEIVNTLPNAAEVTAHLNAC